MNPPTGGAQVLQVPRDIRRPEDDAAAQAPLPPRRPQQDQVRPGGGSFHRSARPGMQFNSIKILRQNLCTFFGPNYVLLNQELKCSTKNVPLSVRPSQ